MVKKLNGQNTFNYSQDFLRNAFTILEQRGWVLVSLKSHFTDATKLLSYLGAPMQDYEGNRSWDIKAQRTTRHTHSSIGQAAIAWHSEYHERSSMPDYIALECIKSAKCGGGQIGLVDGYAFFESLSNNMQERLLQEPIIFETSPSVATWSEKISHETPMAKYDKDGKLCLRLNSTSMHASDPNLAQDIRTQLSHFNIWNRPIAFSQPQNTLLIVDNHRFFHARSAFIDPNRHLKRCLIERHKIKPLIYDHSIQNLLFSNKPR